MKRLLVICVLGACLSACSGPTAPSPETRVIGLTGNLTGDAFLHSTIAAFTITNSGNATLTVTGITFATKGDALGGFTVNSVAGTIAPGGSQMVTVTFAPTEGKGFYTGSFTVAGDQTSGNNKIDVSATGG